MSSCLQHGLPALLYIFFVCEVGLAVLSPTGGQTAPSLFESDRGDDSLNGRKFTSSGVAEQPRKALEFDAKKAASNIRDVAKERDENVNDYGIQSRVDVHPKAFVANVATAASALPHDSHRLQAENTSSEVLSDSLASNTSLLRNRWLASFFVGPKKQRGAYGGEDREKEAYENSVDEDLEITSKETAAIQSESYEDPAFEPITNGDSGEIEAAEGQEESTSDAEADTEGEDGADSGDDDDDDDDNDDSSDDDDDDDDDDQNDYTEPSGMAYYYRGVYYGSAYYHSYYHMLWEGGWGYGFGWHGWNSMLDSDEDDYDGSGLGGG